MSNKLYIFISMNICNIGGSEQYMFNKMHYLERHGFDVYIFSGMNGNVLISGFDKFKDCIIPAVMYSPSLFRKKEVESVIKYIANKTQIEKYEECVIESDGIAEGLWAELLAARYRTKHFMFNVQENHNYSRTEREFIRFKYDRREVAGITTQSIKMMLNDQSATVFPWCAFRAHCNNVVADVPDEFSHLLWHDAFTFGSIGRIEKPFVPKMIRLLSEYFSEHRNEKFNLIFIGGEKRAEVIKYIDNYLSPLANVNVILTGLLYPISRELLSKIDFFVSTAGSAVVSFYEKRPTLNVHPNTCEPAGIYGDSLLLGKGSMFNTIKGKNIIDFINDYREGRTNIKYDVDYDSKEIERIMERDFGIQLENVYKSESRKIYYDVSLVHNNTPKQLLYKLIGKTFGSEIMQNMLDKYRNYRKQV